MLIVHGSSETIKYGVKRELTEEEQGIFDFIRDIFFEGPAFNNESKNRKLLDKIMNSTFMKAYTDEFSKQKNITYWREEHQYRNGWAVENQANGPLY